uniref:Phosphopantothenoylcysteine decarboxylase n=1 Tax=Corethrella appendiculata TaxID=1370023 RepID=U5ESC8_9DIPT
MNNKNILIACTGSVATIKLSTIINNLFEKNSNLNIKIICTKHSKHFFNYDDIPKTVEIYSDEDEWSTWKSRGDPVLHIELGKWADLMLISPLDANTLAKMAQGICDNLLLCTTRAWDMKKPLLFCPAMNTRMWDHPITKQHIDILKSWGHCEIPCISKTLMCGDTGLGAMAEVDSIVNSVLLSDDPTYVYS